MTLVIFMVLHRLVGAQENFRIFPGNVTQTEPVIGISQVDPSFLFASAKTINTSNAVINEGVYVSTDKGLTWNGTDTCSGQYYRNHGGSPQVVIDANNRLILTHIGAIFPGYYSHFSDDSGKTWSNAVTITSLQADDYQTGSLTIDNSPSSIYQGRIYSSWGNSLSPYSISYSSSTNSGLSWSGVKPINNNPTLKSSGGFIRTNNTGTIYACWAGTILSSPFNEKQVGFGSSSDGGITWTYNQNIFNMNGIFGTLPSKNNIRVNGLPQLAVDNSTGPRSGWIYIVTTEINNLPAGSDPDIILHYSSDAGKSWSGGIRVNQDPVNDGKIQYFPALDVDSTGKINILYYDDRNTSSDSAEVWLASSADGGLNWKEQVISDHRFKPKSISGGASGYQGDHIALKSSGNNLYALWMDDYSGIYQIWMKILNLNILSVNEKTTLSPGFDLLQNYPNPFNPSTVINFSLLYDSNVRLFLYNSLGQKIRTIFAGFNKAGSSEIKFTASGLPSGVYLYSIQAVSIDGKYSYIASKKMLLLK
jgi:hypothetical protein